MRTNMQLSILAAVGLCLLLTPAVTHAVYVPPSVGPGELYQLVFVTDGVRDALSSDIADYNTFVNTEAALSGLTAGVTWYAIGSTATVNARDNASVSENVYLVGTGALIASGFADMWDTSIGFPINADQYGTSPFSPFVWTGSDALGFTVAGDALGEDVGGAAPGAIRGNSSASNFNWTTATWAAPDSSNPFYALSEVLIAPLAGAGLVPEPSTALLFVLGAGMVAWMRRRMSPPVG